MEKLKFCDSIKRPQSFSETYKLPYVEVDQSANDDPNFATTEKEPSVKFKVHGIRASWFQTNGNLSRTVLQKKV